MSVTLVSLLHNQCNQFKLFNQVITTCNGGFSFLMGIYSRLKKKKSFVAKSSQLPTLPHTYHNPTWQFTPLLPQAMPKTKQKLPNNWWKTQALITTKGTNNSVLWTFLLHNSWHICESVNNMTTTDFICLRPLNILLKALRFATIYDKRLTKPD